MPGFQTRSYIGHQPLTSIWALRDTPLGGQPHIPSGQIFTADDLWWGSVEAMLVRAGGTIRQFGLCVIAPTFNAALGQWEYIASEAPITANTGRPLGVALRNMTAGQYGWLVIGGLVPVNSNASVAAGATFGIAAVGQGGANVAGRQVLNAVVAAPGTLTVVKNGCTAPSGSTILRAPNADGWFPGIFLSGTGIATGTTAAAIDVNNQTITLSAPTTAAVNGPVTGTYNNATIFYNVAHVNRPFAQGAIT